VSCLGFFFRERLPFGAANLSPPAGDLISAFVPHARARPVVFYSFGWLMKATTIRRLALFLAADCHCLHRRKLSVPAPVRPMTGVPILLVCRGSRLFATAETCSHFSGPLSGGKLVGESIVCPYHSSRFALEDGRAVDGPAVHPQFCLEVRAIDT
jgi:nitrite reductase/ring-hydroxylating ferredoxin subunit